MCFTVLFNETKDNGKQARLIVRRPQQAALRDLNDQLLVAHSLYYRDVRGLLCALTYM